MAAPFKITSPFPEQPIVSGGRQPDSNNAGAVSFIDQTARLLGVIYMEHKDDAAGGDATRQLADWFRATGFPRFFQVSIPDARVLRDEAGSIAGQPAWIAVARGKHYYLLQTELRVEKLATPDWSYDANAAE